MKDLPRDKTQKGQAIVIIVFALVSVVSLVGLAIDGGNAFADRRQAQNAADSAALAAALAYVNNQSLTDGAYYRAKSNGYTNNGVRSKVEVEHPPATGAYSCDNRPTDCQNFIEVRITSNVPTWFSSIVGVKTITNVVSAVARAKKKNTEAFYDGAALVALDKYKCQSFYFIASKTTSVTGSGIFVNSSCSDPNLLKPQAFYSSGNGDLQAPWIKVVGGAHYKSGDLNLEQPITTGAPPYHDIRELYNLPDIDCGAAGAVDENNSTIAGPGFYESFPPEGVTQMLPGKYCVGSLKIKSNLVGDGVVIVTTGAVKINPNAYVSLKARTQGPFAGLLIYMAPVHVQPITIEGNSALELTGTILAPSSDITISGTGKKENASFNSQIIGNTITIKNQDNGQESDMLFNYHFEDNYHPTTPPEVEIVR
jgi:hypothetical protein